MRITILIIKFLVMINRVIFIISIFALNLGISYSQCPDGGAIFVNEIYNEVGNNKEYIELVVIGDPANPTDPVNLEGWIIDDNNINQSGQGNATGHIKLDNTFSSVNPGAIILIYNENEAYSPLPPNNPPWLYVIAADEVDGCSASPSTTNSNYTPCGTSGGDYDYIRMRNPGDIIQTRDASEVYYHALRYGGVNVMSDITPLADVSDNTIGLDCGNWFDGSNYTITTQTPGEANSPANQLLINAIKNGTIDCDNISLSCTPPCPEIGGITINPTTLCDYEDFDVTSTDLANMGQSANTDKDFGVEFVYFPGASPPVDAYSGGTSLGTVAYSGLTGTDPNQEANLTVTSGTMAPGVYNICAILDQTSANDCTPQQCEVVEIFQSPTASLDGETVFCPNDCYQINTVITGGTEPYNASFVVIIGSFNVPFNVPAYDTDDEITICYSGTIAPYWDASSQTFYVPTSLLGEPFTGSGTIRLTSLVDNNGCAAQNIDPDFMTLIFKDDLDIYAVGPIEECDYDFDGKATFVLTDFDNTLKNGESNLTANWYQDNDCTNPVPDPTSFTTPTTTVYVFLTDDTDEKCNSDTIPVDLVVIDIPNPGTDATTEICNDGTCVDFDFEVGNEAGGVWSDDDNTGVDLDATNCVDFKDFNPGTYNFTYSTQDADGKCNTISSVLTVIVTDPGNPGEDNSDTFCGPPQNSIDLNGYLSNPHDDGGIWYDAFDNIVNPSDDLDLSGAAIGTYKYYYVIDNAPCDTSRAEITIEIISQPNAGQDDTISVCNSGQNTIINLESALSTHDSNGDWFDLDTSNVDLSNPTYVDFDGVRTDTFGYKYLIPDNGACLEDSAIITVIVTEAPFAGNDGAGSICIGNTDTINLFGYLGQKYDTTGIWEQIGGDSIDISRPDTMIFTAEPVGIDSFLYVTSGPCGNDSAFVFVSIVSSPYAGDNYSYSICQGSTINLFDSLKNANIGGVWLNSQMDTVTNYVYLDELKEYKFLYIIPQNGTCEGDTAYANITTLQAPEAGTGTDFSVCKGSTDLFNLFDYLSGYSVDTGFWLTSNNTVVNNAKNIDFKDYDLGGYVFKYLVPSNGSCPEDIAYLTVSIVSAPVAGNNNEITVCNGDINNTVDLESLLGSHNSGGQWTKMTNADIDISDVNEVDFSGVSTGTYNFKYLVTSNSTCPSDSAIITVNVQEKLFAGTDKELTFCEGGNEFVNIIDELKPVENTEYTLEDIAQTGALLNNNGRIDISKLNKGTFLFTLTTGDQDLCGKDTSILTINIVEKLNAGTDNFIEVCNDDSSIDINNLLGIHDSGGTWTDIDNSGVDIQTTNGTEVTFENIKGGIYRFEYKIVGSNTCPESKAIITVDVKETSSSNISETLCPGQSLTIGTGTYSLDNPTGTEILTNTVGCDSIISINIIEKSISSNTLAVKENCHGNGRFIIESMEDASLPVKLTINNVGEFDITEFPFEVNNLNGGDYTFTLTDKDGCQSNLDEVFTIDDFIDYKINTKVTGFDNSYSINVETDINPKEIVWTPSDYLSCDNCLNPVAKPESDQEYIITITDEEGCVVSDTIHLNAIEKEIAIDIPNVFTPDGDGKNDFFYAKSGALDLTYTMYIFNRWGEKLFYGENLKFNNATDGWDGTFKGKKGNPGVYVYMIIINHKSNKKEINSGDLLLLR